MKALKSDKIVIMSSISGVTGTPRHAHYSAAKGGLIALMKVLTKDCATFGKTVNAIAPGMVDGTDLISTRILRLESSSLREPH
jgi:NAD(P)-dependent dehydrogenase (short-subunit alcohol dehydrogenase family)